MERKIPELKALVTISTPHHGSSLALLGKYLKPLSYVIKAVMPENTHSSASKILKRLMNSLRPCHKGAFARFRFL